MSMEYAKHIAMNDAIRARDVYGSKLETLLNANHLRQRDDEFLSSMTQRRLCRGYMPSSNFPARIQSTSALIDALNEHNEAYGSRPHHRYYLGTIALGDGICDIDTPIIEEARLRAKIKRLLYKHDLNAIVFPDEVILITRDGELRILAHHHLICWRPETTFRPEVAAKAMMEGRGISNAYGDAVDFRSCDMSDVHVAGLARYGYKMTACVEVERRDPRLESGWRLKKSQQRLSVRLAMRMLEIMSHRHLYESVRAFGPEAKAVRARWKAMMMAWDRSAPRSAGSLSRDYSPTRGWERVWDTVGETSFKPVLIRS